MLLQNVIEHTNSRLQNWYANVKREYGVSGDGSCKLEDNVFHIHYEENGVKCIHSIEWHPNYKIDTIFNIWAEEADPEKDKIEDSPNVLDMNPEEKMPEFLPENKVSNIRLQALGLSLYYFKAKNPNDMPYGYSHKDVLAVAKEFEQYVSAHNNKLS